MRHFEDARPGAPALAGPGAALAITTNLCFADWTQVSGDERLTAALLDRLTHRADILEFAAPESYRFREWMQREARDATQKG